MKHTKSIRPQPKKLRRVQPATCPLLLRVAAFLAGSLADCLAGSWPMLALKPKQCRLGNLQTQRKILLPWALAAPPSNLHTRHLPTVWKLLGTMLS
jgi:hypothetical protein